MTSRSVVYRSRSRGSVLYRDASQVAYALGPLPSRGGDLELEGKYGVVHGILTWSDV